MTDPNAGFQGLQGELSAAGQQTAAAAGHLRIDPEAAEAAAKHCEDFMEQVVELIRMADHVAKVPGLGDYQVSQGLTHHFEQKASQSGSGAIDLLRGLHDEMKNQAAAFRGAAKDYRSMDDENARNLGKATQ